MHQELAAGLSRHYDSIYTKYLTGADSMVKEQKLANASNDVNLGN